MNKQKNKQKMYNEMSQEEKIKHSLQYLLPSGLTEDEWKNITNKVQQLIDENVEETYKKELKIADDRWRRAEKHHRDFHENESIACIEHNQSIKWGR